VDQEPGSERSFSEHIQMATNDIYLQPSIPRFDGHHYDHWNMLMENFRRSLVDLGVHVLAAGATGAT